MPVVGAGGHRKTADRPQHVSDRRLVAHSKPAGAPGEARANRRCARRARRMEDAPAHGGGDIGVRVATAADAAAFAGIYGPIVESTSISFETEAPDAAEMRARVAATLPRRP